MPSPDGDIEISRNLFSENFPLAVNFSCFPFLIFEIIENINKLICLSVITSLKLTNNSPLNFLLNNLLLSSLLRDISKGLASYISPWIFIFLSFVSLKSLFTKSS